MAEAAENTLIELHLCPPKTQKIPCRNLFVEVKRTPQEMAQGMMFRTSLGENDGMIFDFAKSGDRFFWMKNTYVPLDIAFFNGGTLHHVHPHAKPLDETPIPSLGPTDVVLETNAGWFEKANITEGWRLVWPTNVNTL